ncbi:MAG: hypothetical protein LBJ57_07640 [Prevotellaceae bacterium]|jgi:hypothetical protein|nr:hypothetical protein [Prevotellaceae bacterium]
MPERKRTANIGRMPFIVGLPFSLAAIVSVILLAGALAVILLFTFAGLGASALLALALPAAAYAVCFAIGKKYGEFYAHAMSRKPVHAVKTGAWLCQLHEKILVAKLSKSNGT